MTAPDDPVRLAAERIVAHKGPVISGARLLDALTVARAYLSVARPDVTEFAALAELAERATQEMWQRDRSTVFALNDYGSNRFFVTVQGGFVDKTVRTSSMELEANIAFIHAANPATIKRLLAALAERAKPSEDVASGARKLIHDFASTSRNPREEYMDGHMDGLIREIAWMATAHGDARAAAATAEAEREIAILREELAQIKADNGQFGVGA